MTEDTLFSRIVSGEIAADIVYQDDLVTAFRDVNPQMPVHILIVPNRVIPSAADIEPRHEEVLGRMMVAAAKVAREAGIADSGYRLVINSGHHGRQEIYHLHMHLLGGRDCGPMLSKVKSGLTGMHRSV